MATPATEPEPEVFDVVIFGASGFTGKYVIREALKFLPPNASPLRTLALAGRSRDRVAAALRWAAAPGPAPDVPILVADASDPASLAALASRARVLLSCAGPFRLYGHQVAAACAEAGADCLDISGEPEFMERVEADLHEVAARNGSLIVSACGFDSIPAELGFFFNSRQWDPPSAPVSIVAHLSLESHKKIVGNFATFESAVLGFASASKLQALRRSRPRLAKPRIPGPPPPTGPLIKHDKALGLWVMKLPSADTVVVKRTLSKVTQHPEGLPGVEETPDFAERRQEFWSSVKPAHFGETPLSSSPPAAAAMDAGDPSTALVVTAADPSQSAKKKAPKRFIHTPIPPSILSDPTLAAAATSLLPAAYNFELPKTAHRIRASGARRAALQLPEGLLLFSLPLSHILGPFLADHPSNDVLILADPTYGACCLGDRPAKALAADLLVHYGHSCLVPVTSSLLPVLYVFVEIRVDALRLAAAVRSAFPDAAAAPRLALAGTVQFIAAVHAAREMLARDGYRDILVPQAKPLSAGEILGCTAPTLKKSEGVGVVVFVADGRFHLEAFMIANPGVKAYRFDPFLGVLVLEEYDHVGMKQARKEAVLAARKAKSWGVVLGTLGRQGSVKVLDRIVEHLEEKGLEHMVVLMSELSPTRMELFGDSVDAWVQIACPRLSIDWGEGFKKPVLTTFEFDVALGYVPGWWEKGSRECGSGGGSGCCSGSGTCGDGDCSSGDCGGNDFGGEYPMDYYSQDGGDWNGCYMKKKPSTGERRPRVRIGSSVQVEEKQ